MEFIPAGILLGATTRVRTLRLRGAPELPDGDYSFIDCYCTDRACDCRKTMIQVYSNRLQVSLICYGWETAKFYAKWYGASLDARTLAEMQGPSIDIGSPDLVAPHAMLAFFTSILDEDYREHFRSQYIRFKQALPAKTAPRILDSARIRLDRGGNRQRNQACPCGSGRKSKHCCARGR